ncbi:hypothetical protein SS05631_c02410 [Sinorhizobium sp. CCBAU 05631]|nr:hypothetical protein SS05631_c02410 [Sinorhizobium sp. CCBAU 05631]
MKPYDVVVESHRLRARLRASFGSSCTWRRERRRRQKQATLLIVYFGREELQIKLI